MSMMGWLAGLLFPEKCVFCGALTQPGEQGICRGCGEGLEPYQGAERLPRFLSGRVVLWYYEGTVRESLLRFKFRNKPGYGRVYGRLLGEKLSREAPDTELVTWVPVSPKRRAERGYDQAELIARGAARVMGVPCRPALKKLRHNNPQSGISDARERRENVRGVYAVTEPALIRGKRVALIDDILTTGATAGECARMLRQAGAERVLLGAVASGRNNRQTSHQDAGEAPAEVGTYQK